MKTIIKMQILAIAILIIAGCNTSKNSAYNLKKDVNAKTSSSTTILPPPVNSTDAKILAQKIYKDQSYFILQEEKNKFKDNAPFIEYLDGGLRERLWFASSRADSLFYGKKKTNNYQQIYYTERTVGNGLAPNEGWGEVKLLKVETDNPYLEKFTATFNESTKGALTIADNTMIFSCDLIGETGISEYKNLWEMKREGDVFKNPKPILELSNEFTWESQPSISANGKHLFFVSNRKVETDNKTFSNSKAGNDLNIFYSFNENGKWRTPVLVTELYSTHNELTPHISFDSKMIYFACDKEGQMLIYEAPIELNNSTGGYTLSKNSVALFSSKTFDNSSENPTEVIVNSSHSQNYPFIYFNQRNKKTPRAIFWSSNLPTGFGSFDIYGCAMPFNIDYKVTIADAYPSNKKYPIAYPVISLTGYNGETKTTETANFKLIGGLEYQLMGGSTANQNKGFYHCDADANYIFIGYSKIVGNAPGNKSLHAKTIDGAEVKSALTEKMGKIMLNPIFGDSIVNDTVFITRAWEKKPACPGKLNIEPTHRSISYFQTGYWEVNTSANLKRDMAKLHEGFEVTATKDIYNPTGKIKRERSDYKALAWETPPFPIKPGDGYTFSIADAQWIELHPNNLYWGDRPGYESNIAKRMEGRKQRIDQYIEYAKKVDENLKNLTDSIEMKYISLLDRHKDLKPKLLIEIFAVSDQREILRGWYIGDTIQYRGSEYNESKKIFNTEMVKIVPPEVNEKTKTLTKIKACTVELNADGDNGTILGIQQEKTDLNTNLSRLRAWFGYKEVFEKLSESENFKKYLREGRVALPDNNISYDDADIIIITRGKREDGDVQNPKYPYPQANNPTGNGYYDYDKIRRIEIQSRLLLGVEQKVEENYCCDPEE